MHKPRNSAEWSYRTPSIVANHAISIPFKFDKREVEEGEFRESEIHITMNGLESDKILKQKLEQMGFFRAANLKKYGEAHIFTVQGTLQEIGKLWQPVNEFLQSHGGAENCRIKEEQIIDYWLSDGSVKLPPVFSHFI